MGRSNRGCVFFHAASAYHEAVWRPAVDVYRTRSGWTAKFDLAGIRLQDVQIQVAGRCLQVSGVRRDWLIQEGCHYHSLEIAYSRFERQLEFPVDLSHAAVSTDYQAGMLLVRITLEDAR